MSAGVSFFLRADVKFSADFIERVREATNIVDLIGQHVQLKKGGANYVGLCPFPSHQEKTPSFSVSDTKQLYHCFGCKKSGSAYNFLMDFQGMTFPEAVEYLASRAHIAIPEDEKKSSAENEKTVEEKKTLLKLNRYVGAYFQKNLAGKPESHPVKKYLKSRGLAPEIITDFKLGYAEAGWHELSQALSRGHAPLPLAEKLGLIKKKANGDTFDMFRDRLMFPILSANEKVLGFGGRSLSSEQQPKYINSSDSPVFHKGRTLYGLHLTAKHIREQNEAFVVEGYMDLLALYQFGIKNVVATLGTALTVDHAKSLLSLCTKVVALFDGDEAGQAAADKSLPIFLEAGLASRCLTLPGERDPDEFLRELGVDEFMKLANQAPDHFLAYVDRKMRHFRGQPAEKVEIMGELTPMLDRVRDQRLRILYLQEVADRLGLDAQWVSRQLRVNVPQANVKTVEIKNIKSIDKIPTDESLLVQFMLQKSEYLDHIMGSGCIEKFVSEEARMIAQSIVEKYCQNPNDFDKLGALIIAQGIDQGLPAQLLTNHIAFSTMHDELDETAEQQVINDCIARVRERDFKIRSKSILNSIKTEQGTDQEKLEVFLKIAKEHKGPKSPN